MKVQIHLDKGETLESAEELLSKSLKKKQECSHGERYHSEYLNDFHDYVMNENVKALDDILSQVSDLINANK